MVADAQQAGTASAALLTLTRRLQYAVITTVTTSDWERRAMRAAVRKLGNSSGVIIPKTLLNEAGVAVGDTMEVTLENGRIILVPVRSPARAGWAEASKEIAKADDDALVWPEFVNLEDETLDW